MNYKAVSLVLCLLLAACGSDSDTNGSSQSGVLGDQDQFLVDNAARDDVIVTVSGLQYEVLEGSEGAKPNQDDIVTLHYAGTLTDGSEFDSSYARGEPNTFPLAGTILGFAEGVQLMGVGSRYRFVLPPELAYGDGGNGTQIEPGAVLIFVIELLEINTA